MPFLPPCPTAHLPPPFTATPWTVTSISACLVRSIYERAVDPVGTSSVEQILQALHRGEAEACGLCGREASAEGGSGCQNSDRCADKRIVCKCNHNTNECSRRGGNGDRECLCSAYNESNRMICDICSIVRVYRIISEIFRRGMLDRSKARAAHAQPHPA